MTNSIESGSSSQTAINFEARARDQSGFRTVTAKSAVYLPIGTYC